MTPPSVIAALERATAPKRRTSTAPAGTAVAYLRVSTGEQAESGAGLAAQRATITRYADAHGLHIIAWHEDAGASGAAAPHERPGLAEALAAVHDGTAERLIVAKVDRLSRRFRDAVNLMETAVDEGWPMVIADLDADLTTSNGRMTARLLAVMAEQERDMIRARTREALAARKAEGIRLGRPSSLPDAVVRRIVAEREAGTGWQRIADGLEADEVPTARGGRRWYASTVRKVFTGQDAERIRREGVAA